MEILAPLQIPSTYIPQPGVRIALYRRLLQAQDSEEIEQIRREVRDRFGPIPPSVGFLLDVALLRLYGERGGIESIQVTPKETLLRGSLDAFAGRLRSTGWRVGKRWASGPGGNYGTRYLAELISEALGHSSGREEENGKATV